MTLLLLPGFMCDARLFAPQLPILALRQEAVVHIPRQDRLPEMARAALAAHPGPLSLLGLSMGGILAMEMLRQAPNRIVRLALLDTTPLADAPANHAIRTRQIAEVRDGGLDRVMREELKPAYLVDSAVKPVLLDLCLAMARGLGAEVFASQSAALRDRDDLRDALARAPAATLILHGAEDRLCPPERHDLMHRLTPHATRVSVDRAGHLPTLENPTDTTAALIRWLEAP